jgi:hypothetical protein
MPLALEPTGGYRFSERSYANKKLEQNVDRITIHPAPAMMCRNEA